MPDAYVYAYVYVTDTTIRVSEETKRRLELHKREGESYEDVIRRLTGRDKWAGFGAFDAGEGDLLEGVAQIRREFNEGMDERVREFADDGRTDAGRTDAEPSTDESSVDSADDAEER